MKYIKIDKNAVYELLREYVIDKQQYLFNEKQKEDISHSFCIDKDMNFICLLQDESKDKSNLKFEELEKIMRDLPITTDSLYSNSNKYKNLSKKEIQNLLKNF